jgi:hypothetical protein
MSNVASREVFDTGLRRIGHEIKTRLVHHGLFGTIRYIETGSADTVPDSTRIEIIAKGRTVGQAFERKEIEACHLRVGGTVLSGIVTMVDDLSAPPRDTTAN